MKSLLSVELRESSFQALWYFTLLALTLAVVIAACLRYALAGIIGLWHEGNRWPALFLGAACTTVVGLTVAMAVNAAMGLGGTHS